MTQEEQIQKAMFASGGDKTFSDKLFAKDDVDKLRNLVKKPNLTRTDLLEILYLMSGNEQKLLNFGEWDRYVSLKFFVWIREFAKVLEQFYDYKETLDKKTINQQYRLTPRAEQMLENIGQLMEHNLKFLVDLSLRIDRSTLSIGATGFLETLKNKFEMTYNTPAVMGQTVEKKGVFGR